MKLWIQNFSFSGHSTNNLTYLSTYFINALQNVICNATIETNTSFIMIILQHFFTPRVHFSNQCWERDSCLINGYDHLLWKYMLNTKEVSTEAFCNNSHACTHIVMSGIYHSFTYLMRKKISVILIRTKRKKVKRRYNYKMSCFTQNVSFCASLFSDQTTLYYLPIMTHKMTHFV